MFSREVKRTIQNRLFIYDMYTTSLGHRGSVVLFPSNFVVEIFAAISTGGAKQITLSETI
jgi:hypothetical protein